MKWFYGSSLGIHDHQPFNRQSEKESYALLAELGIKAYMELTK